MSACDWVIDWCDFNEGERKERKKKKKSSRKVMDANITFN